MKSLSLNTGESREGRGEDRGPDRELGVGGTPGGRREDYPEEDEEPRKREETSRMQLTKQGVRTGKKT